MTNVKTAAELAAEDAAAARAAKARALEPENAGDGRPEDVQVAEHEAVIEKLRLKAEELKQKAAFREFPKWVRDPTDPTGQRGTTVVNAEEEAAVLDGHRKGEESADQKRKSEEIRAKEKLDEDAAKPLREDADALQKARAKDKK